MSHVRSQLRAQAHIELLAITAFGRRIHKTRLYNFRQADLPACNIYVNSEESEPVAMHASGSRVTQRSASMIVEIYENATINDFDDAMDSLAAEVEKVLGSSTLNSLAFDVSLIQTDIEIDVKPETPVGLVTLTWLVKYRTTESDPETAL